MPRAPDCAKKPTRPGPGSSGASVALSCTAGSLFATPSALDPTTRMPCARLGHQDPLGLDPLRTGLGEPEVSTTSARTPLSRPWSSTSSTFPAGTATTARSTASGMSSTEAYARTPRTERCSGFTG